MGGRAHVPRFCGFPSLRAAQRDRPDLLSMGEWNLCSPSIFTRLEKLLLGIVISPFWIERSKLDETEDNLLLIFSEIWKNFEKLLFGDCLIFDWTKWFWMKWRLQSVVNLGDVVAFEFLSEIRKWFFEDNNLWFLIPSWMEQMCSDIGNIKIRLWTFQRFERLFAIMIFNFRLNEMIWIKMKIDWYYFLCATSVLISQILESWYEEMSSCEIFARSLSTIFQKFHFWIYLSIRVLRFLISNCNSDETEIIFWQVFPKY